MRPQDDDVADGDGVTVQTTWTGEDPSYRVIEAVAAVLGMDPRRMPPLSDTIDLDALDRLLDSHRPPGTPPTRVSFRYEGCRVAVGADGRVTVSPLDG